jgi:parallel beta-helix repeat protein
MRLLRWAMLAVSVALSAPAITAGPASGAEPLPPIVVVGNEGPTGLVLTDHPLTGEPIYRPGSGVVDGQGTAADPYVIAGWDVAAIHLRGTTAHVEIRDNRIGGVPATGSGAASVHVADGENVEVINNDIASADSGILFTDVVNVVAERNRVQGGIAGIDAARGEDVDVQLNTVTDATYAVRLGEVDAATVSGNHLVDTRASSQGGVQVGNSTDVLIQDNTVTSHHTGVYVVSTEGLVVRNNDIGSFSRGINPWFTNGAVIEGNTIDGPQNLGIGFAESSNSIVRGNRVTGSIIGIQFLGPGSGSEIVDNHIDETDYAVVISGGGPHTARDNLLEANDTAIHFSNTTGSAAIDNRIVGNGVGVSAMVTFSNVALHGNHIVGNGVGASNQAPEALDASGNWWGCPHGPGAEGCDTISGNVLVHTWLVEPRFHA